MNKVVKHVFLWAFVLVISISFVAYFGMSGNALAPEQGKIGTVNGEPIYNTRNSDFADNYQLFYQGYQAQGVEINDQVSQYLAQQALRQTILNFLVVEQAEVNFYNVSDKSKLKFIIQNYFNNDKEEFKEYQTSGDKTIQAQIERKTIRNLTRVSFERTMFNSVPASQRQFDILMKVASLEKKVVVAILDWQNSIDDLIQESSLQDYYQKNINRYQRKSQQDGESIDDNSLLLNLGTEQPTTDTQTPANFAEVRTQVLADYKLENESVIIDEIRNNIDFKFKSLLPPSTVGQAGDSLNGNSQTGEATTQQERPTSVEELQSKFVGIAKEVGMELKKSAYFSYLSRSIDEEEEGTVINSENLVKNVFKLNKGDISEVYNTGSQFLVLMVVDEKEAAPKSSFVRNRFKDDLNSDVKNRIVNAYYTALYQDADIQMVQQNAN